MIYEDKLRDYINNVVIPFEIENAKPSENSGDADISKTEFSQFKLLADALLKFHDIDYHSNSLQEQTNKKELLARKLIRRYSHNYDNNHPGNKSYRRVSTDLNSFEQICELYSIKPNEIFYEIDNEYVDVLIEDVESYVVSLKSIRFNGDIQKFPIKIDLITGLTLFLVVKKISNKQKKYSLDELFFQVQNKSVPPKENIICFMVMENYFNAEEFSIAETKFDNLMKSQRKNLLINIFITFKTISDRHELLKSTPFKKLVRPQLFMKLYRYYDQRVNVINEELHRKSNQLKKFPLYENLFEHVSSFNERNTNLRSLDSLLPRNK